MTEENDNEEDHNVSEDFLEVFEEDNSIVCKFVRYLNFIKIY